MEKQPKPEMDEDAARCYGLLLQLQLRERYDDLASLARFAIEALVGDGEEWRLFDELDEIYGGHKLNSKN